MKEKLEMPKSHFMQSGENLSIGSEYCLIGEAVNGTVNYIGDGIIGIGEDTILFRPEHNLYGVFDGAGGETDIGRADLASQTAATAVAEYFEKNDTRDIDKEFMADALLYARSAVAHTKGAGITTGLFLRLSDDINGLIKVQFACAGDCVAAIYPDPIFDDRKYDDVLFFAGDQADRFGHPTNFLGTEKARVKRESDDQIGQSTINTLKKRWLIVSSDGIFGSYGVGDGLDEADIKYAFTYNKNITKIAEALLNPPMQRDQRRKVDDKSLIVISF